MWWFAFGTAILAGLMVFMLRENRTAKDFIPARRRLSRFLICVAPYPDKYSKNVPTAASHTPCPNFANVVGLFYGLFRTLKHLANRIQLQFAKPPAFLPNGQIMYLYRLRKRVTKSMRNWAVGHARCFFKKAVVSNMVCPHLGHASHIQSFCDTESCRGRGRFSSEQHPRLTI